MPPSESDYLCATFLRNCEGSQPGKLTDKAQIANSSDAGSKRRTKRWERLKSVVGMSGKLDMLSRVGLRRPSDFSRSLSWLSRPGAGPADRRSWGRNPNRSIFGKKLVRVWGVDPTHRLRSRQSWPVRVLGWGGQSIGRTVVARPASRG